MQLIKARPTTYKGIKMRSRLEAHFAAWLDEQELSWTYEPNCFAGPLGQWLPDFRVNHPSGKTEYIEVKPSVICPVTDVNAINHVEIDAILGRMEIAWLSDPKATLGLYFPRVADGRIGGFAVFLAGLPGDPWRLYDESDAPGQIWPGMGQLTSLVKYNCARLTARGIDAEGAWR